MAYFEKRVTKAGVVRWRVQVRRRGVEHTRTFRSKMRAREWALQIEAGITGESRTLPRHTLLEGIDRYAAAGRRGTRPRCPTFTSTTPAPRR